MKTIAGLEKPAIEFSYEGVTVGYPMFIRPCPRSFYTAAAKITAGPVARWLQGYTIPMKLKHLQYNYRIWAFGIQTVYRKTGLERPSL